MSQDEFLFLIPGVIYGIAIFDLISIIRSKNIYWESLMWVILLFFCIISILFNLYPRLEAITADIRIYTLFLFSPILFAHSCYLLTPREETTDLKVQFMENRQKFFMSISGVVLIGLILFYIGVNSTLNIVLNLAGFSFFLLNAFFDKIILRVSAAAYLMFWVILTYLR